GVLAHAGQVDHGRAEDRPVAGEANPAAEADFLAVAKILDRRVDVAVEAELAYRRIGMAAADDGVDLVAANGEIVLVEAETVGEGELAAELDGGSADDVGQAVGEAGAGGKDARLVVEAVALADGGPDGDSGEVERPVYAVGHPGAVLPAVVAGEAI